MLKRLLRHLWSNEDGFFGIGMGPTKEEKGQYGDIAGIGDFGTSEGKKDTLASDNFWHSILSGDPGKIATVLGPEISGINKQGQQQKKTTAEFGNRGGGTNASEQMAGDNTRTSYDSLVAELTGKAAGALGASGASLLSVGLSAHDTAFSDANIIHQQKMAKTNDLFKSITAVAAAPFTGGASLGLLAGGSKGGGGGKPGEADEDGSEFDTPGGGDGGLDI